MERLTLSTVADQIEKIVGEAWEARTDTSDAFDALVRRIRVQETRDELQRKAD